MSLARACAGQDHVAGNSSIEYSEETGLLDQLPQGSYFYKIFGWRIGYGSNRAGISLLHTCMVPLIMPFELRIVL